MTELKGHQIWTQADVSRISGVPDTTLSAWVRKGWVPSPDVVAGGRCYYSAEGVEAVLAAIRTQRGEA